MRYLKHSMERCLESFLTKGECWSLVRNNRMKDIQSLCTRSGISPSLFLLKGTVSLSDIYVTDSDWEIFISSMGSLSDPSANALSHYQQKNKDRITTNKIFFTDSTSGVTLLNPRFTYLVNKSNEKLLKSFPDIHKSISIKSVPSTAADIENYYTEIFSVLFSLVISYKKSGIEKEKTIKLIPDKDAFIKVLKEELKGRSNSSKVNNSDNKEDIILTSIRQSEDRISVIQDLIDKVRPYIDSIDDLLLPKKVLNKNLLGKINDLLPESLHDTIYKALKEGKVSDKGITIYISDKPIVGKSLKEILLNTELSLIKRKEEEESKLKSVGKGDSKEDTIFQDYVNALVRRISDIYDFVIEKPFNDKGSIPSTILTRSRNRNAIIYVLCPNATDIAHRCLYLGSVGEDSRLLKYNFNAAGTDKNTYDVVDNHVVVK